MDAAELTKGSIWLMPWHAALAGGTRLGGCNAALLHYCTPGIRYLRGRCVLVLTGSTSLRHNGGLETLIWDKPWHTKQNGTRSSRLPSLGGLTFAAVNLIRPVPFVVAPDRCVCSLRHATNAAQQRACRSDIIGTGPQPSRPVGSRSGLKGPGRDLDETRSQRRGPVSSRRRG